MNTLMPSKMRVSTLMALRNIRERLDYAKANVEVFGLGTPAACRGSLRIDSVTQHRTEIPVIGGVCLNSANE